MEKPVVDWIAEITCLARKTVVVQARTRKEALEILRSPGYRDERVMGLDISYGPEKSIKVIGRDGLKTSKEQ